jgi:hypothetical protein
MDYAVARYQLPSFGNNGAQMTGNVIPVKNTKALS